MTKCIKIYSEPVTVDESTHSFLVSCYRNHLVIYNEMVDIYRADKTLTYKQLKVILGKKLAEDRRAPVITSVLHSEIYYMHKKADFKQKLVTAIQYMSTISSGYEGNRILEYNPEKDINTIRFIGYPLVINLSKPLPKLTRSDETIYMNLSYPGGGGNFVLSVFSKPD